jgi:pimeloyl-ACP methyl ester carboxylesterase
MSAIMLESKIVHYEVLGRGRPVLFLHGWIGSWRYWIPVMQAVSSMYRAYALDFWGFGDTARASQCYPLNQQVKLVQDVLDQMGIGRIALIGHGLGAAVAMLTALSDPQRFDRLMLVGFPFEESQISARMQTNSPPELCEWLVGRGWQDELDFADVRKVDADALQQSLVGLNDTGLQQAWLELQRPCLFVYAGKDLLVTPPEMPDLPDWAHVIHFENSGHFMMHAESSQFNRLVLDFLSLESGVSPQQLQLKEEWKRRVR